MQAEYIVDIYKKYPSFSVDFELTQLGTKEHNVINLDPAVIDLICIRRFKENISIWEIAYELNLLYSIVHAVLNDVILTWDIDFNNPEHKEKLKKLIWRDHTIAGVTYHVSNTGLFINAQTKKAVPWLVSDPDTGVFRIALGFAEELHTQEITGVLLYLFWPKQFEAMDRAIDRVDSNATYPLDIDATRFRIQKWVLSEKENEIIRRLYDQYHDIYKVLTLTGYDIHAIQYALGNAYDPSYEDEEWRPVAGLEAQYQVSNYGRFIDKATGVVFEGTHNDLGILQIPLTSPGSVSITDPAFFKSEYINFSLYPVLDVMWVAFKGLIPRDGRIVAVKHGKQDAFTLDDLELVMMPDDIDYPDIDYPDISDFI